MNAGEVASKSWALLQEALPDLASRTGPFTVLTQPADPSLQRLFLDHIAKAAAEIRAALDGCDYAGLKRHVHTLKGMGGSVGYPEVSAVCLRIEETIAAGHAESTRRLTEALLLWHAVASGSV